MGKKNYHEEMLKAKDEYEPELTELVFAYGHYDAARRLLLKEGTPPQELALMRDDDVMDAIQTKYAVVARSRDENDILLVPRDKMAEFNKLAVWLER